MTMAGLCIEPFYAVVVIHWAENRLRRASMASKAFLILAMYSFL
jgi:hypothetical protein